MSDDAQFWRDLLAAVTRELDDGEYGQPWRGTENAPGHAHDVLGVWDSDNGSKAGKPCAWCMTWNRARAALAASPERSISENADVLLTAARRAILALTRAAEHDPAFQRDYEALSNAIDVATRAGARGTSD
ncbi:hypothetical protein [Burkholderia gladioli]|uniref:hypothetical protein n=1 Tax=Burkholderia gladioli TaxID=28095 RepID=UPI00163FFB7B|nr:hypothetical protein [Burkholderia gladioli]